MVLPVLYTQRKFMQEDNSLWLFKASKIELLQSAAMADKVED